MKISQYVYLDIGSDTVTAAEVTAYLGMEPDKVRVRGTRRAEPPVPASHSWSVTCREPGLPLDIQIGKVLDRVAPLRERLRDLGSTKDVWICLVIVRHFDHPEGEEEHIDAATTERGELLEKLPGQHQLLGWYLDTPQLEFLAYVNAAILADEYG